MIIEEWPNQQKQIGPHICFNQIQGNKLCGVISALIFYRAIRLDTKLPASYQHSNITLIYLYFSSKAVSLPIVWLQLYISHKNCNLNRESDGYNDCNK